MKAIAIANPIVHTHRSQVFTDSLVIAEAVGLQHRRVIALIRKHQTNIEEFGFLTFQTSKKRGTQGLKTEYAILTEDQATFLMMLFKPSPIVIKFRVELVKAFRRAINEIARLRNQASEPAWKLIRDETKTGFKWMTENLKDQRETDGKSTQSVHYMNETKLINSVITGVFAGIDRNALPQKHLAAIADLQRLNARLIAQGQPYSERKARLLSYLTPKLAGGCV